MTGDDMFAAASDPLIWEQHPASDRYEAAVFRRYFDDALACGGGLTFVDNDTNRIIGSSRYYGFDEDKSEVEIGWTFLVRDCWGGDYNREIKSLMLDHAFSFVDTVIFWVGESNTRSRRAMEKIGGVLREGIFRREPGGDASVIYEIKRG